MVGFFFFLVFFPLPSLFFRFSKDAATGIVSWKVKVSPLDQCWVGRPDNPNIGFVSLKSVPPGFPSIIAPTPVDDFKLRHVRNTYPEIGPDASLWWDRFFADQTFWCTPLPAAYDATIWDFSPPAAEPVAVFPAPERHGRTPCINMGDQRLSSFEELEVGMLVAVHPAQSYYAANPPLGRDTPAFWVAEVTGSFFRILFFPDFPLPPQKAVRLFSSTIFITPFFF